MMAMKILLGPGLKDPVGNEAFLVKYLKRVADVRTFGEECARFDEVLKKLPFNWNPDVIIIRDAEYYRIPENIDQVDVPIVALIGDYNLSLPRMLPIMDCFDYFFCDLKGVKIFRKLGFNNCDFFCLYGYDPEVHRDYGGSKDFDVVFVGNLNHAVQQEREAYLYELAKLRSFYRVYIGTGVYGRDYAKLLNGSWLVFNKSIRQEANMRFFEALGCGTVVLDQDLEELRIMGFRANTHYIGYDFQTLAEKVHEFFSRGCKKVTEEVGEALGPLMQHHTYYSRALELVNRIKELNLDPSKRRFKELSDSERKSRWELFYSKKVFVPGTGMLDRFHPTVVSWQKHLVDNELEVKNLDVRMWKWWFDLLLLSGLEKQARRFFIDRMKILEAIPQLRRKASEFFGFSRPVGS